MLCMLRPPAAPQVYGVVLPHDSDPRLAAPRSRSEPQPRLATSEGQLASAGGSQEQQLLLQAAGQARAGDEQAAAAGSDAGGSDSTAVSSLRTALLLQREATLPAVVVTLPQELPGPVANPPAIVMEYVSGKSLGAAGVCSIMGCCIVVWLALHCCLTLPKD